MSDNLKQTLVKLTSDLVSIPGSSERNKELHNSIFYIKNYFSELEGITIKEYSKHEIPSIVLLPKGIDTPDILLISHVDVIHHSERDAYNAKVVDDRIYGPGAGDMKGQLSIMMELFRYFHSSNPGISLGLAITSDEEVGGECGVGFLFNELGLRCGLVINPDGGSLNEITVAEKGVIHMKIHSTGDSAHAARPWLGINALELLTEKCLEIKNMIEEPSSNSDTWRPTCSITSITTENDSVNRIPELASAVLDIRFIAPATSEKIIENITNLLDQNLSLEILLTAEPVEFESDAVFEQTVESVTGLSVSLIKEDGASDCRYIHPHGIPVIISRPLVGDLHTTDEWIDIDSMIKFYEICKQFINKKIVFN